MAIACLRFFTLCLPERMWCISVRTSWLAFLLYLRPLDFFLELPDFERLEPDFLRELDFVAMYCLPFIDETYTELSGLAGGKDRESSWSRTNDQRFAA